MLHDITSDSNQQSHNMLNDQLAKEMLLCLGPPKNFVGVLFC